jgi:hypothetical protein
LRWLDVAILLIDLACRSMSGKKPDAIRRRSREILPRGTARERLVQSKHSYAECKENGPMFLQQERIEW